MHTIKGFTTTKDIIEQLEDAGISIKLPFTAINFKCKKKFKTKFKDSEGKEFNYKQL